MPDDFQPINDNVWYYPPDPEADTIQPGVGAIITANDTVLVDAGNGPRHARRLRAALRSLDAPPVRYIIYTHHHWDHTFGAQLWSEAAVIAHHDCRTLLQERYGDQPWSPLRIEEEKRLNPARETVLQQMMYAMGDWQIFALVLPTITFSGEMQFMLDDLPVKLRHIGGGHSADSITVRVNDVMFLGDCFYPPPLTDDPPDVQMVEALLAEDAQYYIDSHSTVLSREEMSAWLARYRNR